MAERTFLITGATGFLGGAATVAALRAGYGPQLRLLVRRSADGTSAGWADSRYMHTLYSVTAAEAARSSLPVFVSRAGVPDAHLNGLAEWVIRSKYRVGAQAWFWHLRGAAAGSPFAVQRVQTTVVGWLAYRFN